MSVRVTVEQLKIKVKKACLQKTHAKQLLIQMEFNGTPVKDIRTKEKRAVRQYGDKCELLIKFIFICASNRSVALQRSHCFKTIKLATAIRSRVNIHGWPCKHFHHSQFDNCAKFGYFSHTVGAYVGGPKISGDAGGPLPLDGAWLT